MRLHVVNPNTTASMTAKIAAAARAVALPGTVIDARQPAMGPDSIEGFYDEAFAVPGMLGCIREADRDGAEVARRARLEHVVALVGREVRDASELERVVLPQGEPLDRREVDRRHVLEVRRRPDLDRQDVRADIARRPGRVIDRDRRGDAADLGHVGVAPLHKEARRPGGPLGPRGGRG